MDCRNIDDIAELIARRDECTIIDAYNLIDDCIVELQGAIMRGNFQEAEDIVMSYLGLEPDYLDILMENMY